MKIAKYKIFLAVVPLLYSLTANTQNHHIDSLKKVLEGQKEDTSKVITLGLISDNFFYSNDLKEAIQYANLAAILSKKLEFKRGEAEAYTSIGYCYGRLYNWPDARKNYEAALSSRQVLGDKSGIGDVYILIAGTFNGESNYPEALKNIFSALKFYEAAEDKNGISHSHLMIGLHHYNQQQNDEALKEFLISLKIQNEVGDKLSIAQSYSLIGQIYFKRGDYEEALKNDSDALKIYQQLEESRGIANVFQSIGEIYEKQGEVAYRQGNLTKAQNDFREANINYLKSLKISESQGGSKMGLGSVYVDLGNINIKLKKYPEATVFLEKGRMVSEKIRDKQSLCDNYLSSSILDSALGNFHNAYKNFKKYISYRDSLINEASTSKSLQLKLQYEFDKKEAATKAEQDKKDADAKRIKNQQYFAIIALGIVVSAVIIIALIQFRNNKQKQKANIVLENALANLKSTQAQLVQKEKMASLGELTSGIAHEIQNPLNFVNNFSDVSNELLEEMKTELEKGNTKDAIAIVDDVKQNLEKILHHGKRADAIVKGMLQHSRTSSSQKELTDINALVDEYLRLAYHGLRAKDKSFNAKFITDFDSSLGKINIIPQEIGRVILNLINNAFYAVSEKQKAPQSASGGGVMYEPTVSVSTKQMVDKILIAVADNGGGIPQKNLDKIFQPFFTTKPTGQGTGLGLSLAYDIITQGHNGEMKVETHEGEGSKFIVIIPSTQ